jgi:osmotically-inducible protein OsmY
MSAAAERLTVPSRTRIISSFKDFVAVAAEARLLKSSCLGLRHVSCEFDEGVLTLRGAVPSSGLKQVAQDLVGRLNGVAKIENRLDVTPVPVQSKTRRS